LAHPQIEGASIWIMIDDGVLEDSDVLACLGRAFSG
jgi:hypothetical protein